MILGRRVGATAAAGSRCSSDKSGEGMENAFYAVSRLRRSSSLAWLIVTYFRVQL
jgi:hypothetical protein